MAPILTLIPARRGSKRVRDKNLRMCGGKPLIVHTVQAALGAGLTPLVLTDSREIAAVGKEAGARIPFFRDATTSHDTASTKSLVQYTWDYIRRTEGTDTYEGILLLQPTSPLRTADDIHRVLDLRSSMPKIVSVTEVHKARPVDVYSMRDGILIRYIPGLPNRLEPLYTPNGAIYYMNSRVADTGGWFLDSHCLAYVMPPERSVDIDTELDLAVADALLTGKIQL